MDIEIRPITGAETESWVRSTMRSFGKHISEDELKLRIPLQEEARSLAAFDGNTIVGGAHALSLEMNIPGGRLPTAAVTSVGVSATHRRRGILRNMMTQQLKDVYERGEPLAALWSSESIIYGRFGYGIGSFHEHWTINKQHTAFTESKKPKPNLEYVNLEKVQKEFPDIYRRALVNRPGAIQPPTFHWDRLIAEQQRLQREGSEAMFFVTYKEAGQIDGYVSYQIKGETVVVSDLITVTDKAHAELWKYCSEIDLMSTTEADHRPVDAPIMWMLSDPRRLQRTTADALWVRLVNICNALSERHYMELGRLVLEVKDSFCPWNDARYELEGGPEGSICRLSSKSPDVVLSASDLASVYLGTVNFTTLSRAGRIEEQTNKALLRADVMFATELKPWCPYEF